MTSNPSETKERMLTIARRLFAQKGYASTSVDAIVKACGVSKGTFYWHFEGKGALFLDLMRDELTKKSSLITGEQEEEVVDLERWGAHFLELFDKDRDGQLLGLDIRLGALRGYPEMQKLFNETCAIFEEGMRNMSASYPKPIIEGMGDDTQDEWHHFFHVYMSGLLQVLNVEYDVDTCKSLWSRAVHAYRALGGLDSERGAERYKFEHGGHEDAEGK